MMSWKKNSQQWRYAGIHQGGDLFSAALGDGSKGCFQKQSIMNMVLYSVRIGKYV